MAELLSYAETQKLLDELDKDHQALIDDLIPAQISLGGVQRVFEISYPNGFRARPAHNL